MQMERLEKISFAAVLFLDMDGSEKKNSATQRVVETFRWRPQHLTVWTNCGLAPNSIVSSRENSLLKNPIAWTMMILGTKET